MKVVCIKNLDGFTVGKQYNILKSIEWADVTNYHIIDDNSNERWYNSAIFISLADYRKLKLEKVLNEM